MSRIKSSNVQFGDSFVFGNSEKQSNSSVEQEKLLNEAKKQAQELLNNANDQASLILQKAEDQVQQMFQSAHEEGFQAGYNTGYSESFNQHQQKMIEEIKSLDVLTESCFEVKKEIISSAEQEILKLSVVIAEKIIKQSLENNNELILNIVKSSINELKDKEEISILVNPAVTEILYEFSEELKQTVKGLKNIKIIEDRTIPKDGILVQSQELRIDASVEIQIAEITKKLFEEYYKAPIIEDLPVELEAKIKTPARRTKKSKND